MGDELSFIGLFAGCFLSATIIPFASEAFVIAMLFSGFDPASVVIIASLGNWLGGLSNYLLGRLADLSSVQGRFRIKQSRLEQFRNWIEKYGTWVALVTWLPVLGDPLTIVLGFFRISFWKVAVLSFIGKFLRYVVLALFTLFI